jgi:pilus assembly protein FimV
MKQSITLAMLLSLAVSSPLAHALGVGEAQVGSALNAPLDASIPLIDAPHTPETLSVSLAQRSAYAAAGLEWSDVIADVNATLQGQPPIIRLTSSQPIDVPWLDLLVVIESPSGRHAHDVTLLFDPIDYEAVNRVTADSRAEPRRADTRRIDAGRDVSRDVSRDVGRNAVNAGVNNPAYVNSGDTLWSVAERIKPASASVQQMMVALLEANPGVFPSGNINAMRAGFRLDVPADAQVMRRSAAASAEAIDAMNAAWRNRDNGLAAVALPEPNTAANPDDGSPAEQEAGAITGDSTGDSTELSIVDAAIASAEAVSSSREAGSLTDQLEQSQAMLAQLIEEREQMRGELDALRREVSELTEALGSQARVAPSTANDIVQEREIARDVDVDNRATERSEPEGVASAEATQDTQIGNAETPASDNAAGGARGFPSLPALMENYRWTLMTAGLVLLLVLLLLIRRRQAKEWVSVDQATISEPSVAPKNHVNAQGATQENVPKQETSGAETPQTSSFTAVEEPFETEEAFKAEKDFETKKDFETEEDFETDPFTEPSPTIYAAQEGHTENAEPEAIEPVEYEMDEPLEWEADDDDVLSRSQAAGLASQRSAASHQSKAKDEAQTEAAPAPPEDSSSEQDTQADSRFIDYQPPTLSAEPAAPREETPMQPTVEFEPVKRNEPQGVENAEKSGTSPADNVADDRQETTKTDSDSPLGEGWEIEEVAFKVPGRDNARSS